MRINKGLLGFLSGFLSTCILISFFVHGTWNRSDRKSFEISIDSVAVQYQPDPAREINDLVLDTVITRFGTHPGSLAYDTSYTISYVFETNDVVLANEIKKVLQKVKVQTKREL
jgi:hypothetical protein